MIFKKLFFLICTILAFQANGLFANGSQDDTEVVGPQETADLRVVVDGLGREVVIPENPQRVLALNANQMETLFCIGITPVGKVDEYKIRQEGMALPSVGQARHVNIEAIQELAPDFIIAHARHHATLLESLEQTGATVYYINPALLLDDPLWGTTMEYGRLFEREDEAAAYKDKVDTKSAEFANRIREETPIRTVLILTDNSEEVMVARRDSFFGALVGNLQLTNIVIPELSGSSETAFVSYDIETILEADPDIILLMASSRDRQNNKANIAQFKNDPKWSSLSAVQNNMVRTLPFKVKPGRISIADAVTITAKVILNEHQK